MAKKSSKSVLKEGMRRFARLFAAASLMGLAACVTKPTPRPAPAPQSRPANQAPTPAPRPMAGGDEKFQAFVRDFQATALARGVTAETYAKAMTGIAPIATVASMLGHPSTSAAVTLAPALK